MIDTFLYTPADNTISGPHVRDAIDLKRSMVIVVLALLPAFFFGTYNVGLQEALHLTGVTFQNINLDFLPHFLSFQMFFQHTLPFVFPKNDPYFFEIYFFFCINKVFYDIF
jgi:Na+-transporting NADH:ubiquinone oxidoreductase subunit B